jgi:aminoglycoside/choline kinase family phosphotransferase
MRAEAAKHEKPLACESSAWLPAEVSTRRYARLTRLQHYPLETAIAMVFPKGTPSVEVARIERATRLLGEAGVPVPEIYDARPEAGWILQEDLGDHTLAASCAAKESVEAAYAEALEILPRVVALGSLDTSPQPPLDGARMRQELELFATGALMLDGPPGRALDGDLSALAEACAALPVTLCHRDYHARNLLLHEGAVRVVDHQDALAGPEPYDRVSLAYDPYVDLPDARRDEIAGDSEGTALVAVQRLAKVIGTYAEKGGDWRDSISPAARQARRLMPRTGLRLPVLEAALATLGLPTG